MATNSINIIEMKGIVKTFPGVKALNNVGLCLKKGEIIALVGENGAGKSTLIKILSGAYTPDEGEIYFNGKLVTIKNPLFAINLGISTIYQETALVQELSIAENIFLGRQPRGSAGIDWKKMNDDARKILEKLSLDLDTKTIISDLSAGKQQFIEIAKALSIDAQVIVLDEPTSSMVEEDAKTLFSVLNKIKAQGTSAIYISHKLDEVFQIADRAIVLRDGNLVHENDDIKNIDEDTLIDHMFGREVGNIFADENYEHKENIVLEVKELSRKEKYRNISFNLREGEILGFFGLVGAGRTEIVRGIYGLDRTDTGTVLINGKKIEIKTPKDSVKNGIAFVSEDRRLESIIQEFSVVKNTTILIINKLISKIGLINFEKEKKLTKKYIDSLSVKTSSLDQLVRNLSGGNQQKVALAKCLASEPKILILDEPTKGIDVHAKKEIHSLIKKLARDGMSIILVSSELPEIMGMSHRAIVIREGEMNGNYDGAELTEANIMRSTMKAE